MNLNEINLDLDAAGSWPLPVKIAAVALVCVFVVGGWAYMDTLDQWDRLETVQKKESDLRNTFEAKQKKAASLEAYKAQLKEIEETFGIMLGKLPDKTQVDTLLENVSQTGLASGLEFELFKPEAEIKKDFYAELPINLRVVGGYDEFANFVSGLASMSRIVTVHDMTISLKEKDTDNMIMDAVVKTYRYLDDQEQAPPPDASKNRKRRG